MTRSTISISALAVLAAMQPAKADFNDYVVKWWRGNWIYSGHTALTEGSLFENAKSIVSQTATAKLPSGKDHYLHVGVLARSRGLVLENKAGATIGSVVTGADGSYAAGVATEAAATLMNNGSIDATNKTTTGEAFGLYTNGEAVDVTNGPLASISAHATGHAVAARLFWTQSQTLRNYGLMTAKSTGIDAATPHTPNDGWRDSSAEGIDSFVHKTGPTSIENSGNITVESVSRKLPAIGMFLWNNFSTVTLVNNGIMSSRNTGGKAQGVYMGTNGYPTSYTNTGAWIADGTAETEGGVFGVWLENNGDGTSTKGDMSFSNSGTIATNNAFAVHIGSYGAGPWSKASFTNTGTISGNWLGLQWNGDVDFYNSGDIYTKLAWIGRDKSNVRAVISGLPRIQPVLTGSENGTNTLVFNLTGTLEKVNGQAASGTDLSQFALGVKGEIQVSGRTYKWNRFGSVTGTVKPKAKPLAGPAGVSGRQTSPSEAALAWNPVAGATSYVVKRAQVPTGPYTTLATGVTAANYKDATAYAGLDSYYVVSALVGGVETADSQEVSLRHTPLTGTPIGTPGSFYSGGNTIAKVFDGDRYTFFDSPKATGDWVGLDFGQGQAPVVKRIAFSPRNRYETRMVGGSIQGANNPDFSDAETLYTITRTPLMGMLTSVDIENTRGFRYVRYIGPKISHTNLTELRFYAN